MSDMQNDFIIDDAPEAQRTLKIKDNKSSSRQTQKSIEEQTIELDKAQKNLVMVYKNEEKVPVRIAPSYAKYFGKVMRVAINGISVAVKCDGNTVMLPTTFATEVMRRMNQMDAYDLKLTKMGNVTKNVESSPGQLNFFN